MALNRRDIFNMIMETFPVLELAYGLKEEYRKFNRDSTYDEAAVRINALIDKFKKAEIRQFDEFTAIPCTWRNEILNSFIRPYGDRKLSNSFTKNINGRIKTYLAVSNGISNFQRFRKRVIFALSPDIYYALTPMLASEKRDRKKRGPYNKSRD